MNWSGSSSANAREIAFVLDNIGDPQGLAVGLPSHVRVHVLDAAGDVLGQIINLLEGQAGLDAIHLFSHGSAGSLNLGKTSLNASTLPGFQDALARIGAALSNDGDILLYGCDVAQGTAGADLIGRLAQATGADIAASTDTTGASALGGNWVLEAASGTVDVATLQVAGYAGTLAAPALSGLDPVTFVEGSSSPVLIDSNINFTGGDNYGGGYIRYAISDPSTGDQLTLSSSATPNALGAISFDAGVVYRGAGGSKIPLGVIDAVDNGQNGKPLKINFVANFQNPGFESVTGGGAVTGWTIGTERVILGTTVINGKTAPADTTWPANSGNSDADPATMTFSSELSTAEKTEGNASLRLYNNGTTQNGFDVVHGPYAYSNTFAANANDVLFFDWQAKAGSDAYDAFGYLMNADTGAYQIVLNETGASYTGVKPWTTTSVTVPSTGNWFFVFVSGTYDFTGGRAVGGSLFIDNFKVSSNSVTTADLQAIAQQIDFQNTAKDTKEVRDLTLTVADGSNNQASTQTTLTITQANNAPELSGPSTTLSFAEDANPAVTGKSVASLFNPLYADPDNVIGNPDPLSGIIVVGDTSDASGAWQYSLDNGTTWQAIGTVSDAAGLWLPSTALLNFVLASPENWRGTAAPELSVHLVDSSTGAPTAGPVDVTSYKGVADSRHPVSAGTYTVKAVVTASNDAPVYVAGGTSALPTVSEDVTTADNTGALVSTLVTGTVTDVDTAAGGPLAGEFADGGIAIYATSSTAGAGKFQYSTNGGTTWVDAPALSTTSALLLRSTDKLRFQPDAAKGGTGSFSFYIWDGATGTAGSTADVTARGGQTAFSQAGETGSFTVTDVPDAPVALGISNTTTTGKGVHSYATGSRFTDLDGDAFTYSYTATDGGNPVTLDWLSIDPATGTLSGNPPTPAGGKTYAITVTAKDPSNLSVSSTFNWTFTNTTDPLPVANSLGMTPATDSGTNTSDNITNNGLPVLTFTGEPGLAPTLKGPDGTTLTLGQHYRIDYNAGTQTHTVVLLDAQPGGSANPFGSFHGSIASGNPASTADGQYELTVSNSDGSVVVGRFEIDTTAPALPAITLQTVDTDQPVITGTVGAGALPAGGTLAVTINGAIYDNVTVAGDGSWSVNTATAIPKAGTALGAFVAGQAYDVTAVVTDAAGNTSTDNTGGEFRKTAPPTKAGEGLFTYTVPDGTFGGGGGLTYTAALPPAVGGTPAPLPGWLTFDPTTQTLSGNPPANATSPLVVRVTADDGNGNIRHTDLTLTFSNTNDIPTITGMPSEPGTATYGLVSALPDYKVFDGDSDSLTVTIATTNVFFTNVVDADPLTPGVQITGRADDINAALAAMQFVPSALGLTTIQLSVTDGVIVSPIAATHQFNVVQGFVGGGGSGNGGGNGGGATPPADQDNDGIPPATEAEAPALVVDGKPAQKGDGNGDGIADNMQSSVSSAPFFKTDKAVSNPGNAPQTFITLVANSDQGRVGNEGTAQITSLTQQDHNPQLPSSMVSSLGSIVSTIAITGHPTETFSIYVDGSLPANGFWVQDNQGGWANLASAAYGGRVVAEGNKLRLDFQIADGGAFDRDGKADGVITLQGEIGQMPLTIVGYIPETTQGGFWF
ncbi:DUF4347 domain-containing protein [Alicycliphilus denitrificans]|uniref:DUF4347 domain-containing protein n=1 Tax=Alicycliphilus denitrificans TaxID=179636 RepID=UPI00384F72C7